MLYRYLVAHSSEALPKDERALYSKSQQEVEHEYDQIGYPFETYFQDQPLVKADYERHPDGVVLMIEAEASEGAIDILVSDFLVRLNRGRPGLGMVLKERLHREQ